MLSSERISQPFPLKREQTRAGLSVQGANQGKGFHASPHMRKNRMPVGVAGAISIMRAGTAQGVDAHRDSARWTSSP